MLSFSWLAIVGLVKKTFVFLTKYRKVKRTWDWQYKEFTDSIYVPVGFAITA